MGGEIERERRREDTDGGPAGCRGGPSSSSPRAAAGGWMADAGTRLEMLALELKTEQMTLTLRGARESPPSPIEAIRDINLTTKQASTDFNDQRQDSFV